MYDIPAGIIGLGLLVLIVVALEAGYRLGIRRRERTDELSRAHIHLTETSTLALLALLLAFSFSAALQRFDSRSDQVVDEVNAIGTLWLRTDLLPPQVRDDVRRLMRRYVDLQVEATRQSTATAEWRAVVDEVDRGAGCAVVLRPPDHRARRQRRADRSLRPGAQRDVRLIRPA